MKILAISSHVGKNEVTKNGVDAWRIKRPLDELAKHTGWQIDHQRTPIKQIDKFKNEGEFTKEEMERAFKHLCEYDIIFSSYHADPTGYTMFKVARDKAGVQFVMDVDDDMFAVNPNNPFWAVMTDEQCYWMQRMIADNDWITTTTPELAKVFQDRRPGKPKDSVFVLPNYIPKSYKHPKFSNGDKIVIGYFGGASHQQDLHETGVAEALEKLMHENKNIYFKSVGIPLDKYLPKARYTFEEGTKGTAWITKAFPKLNFDIGIGPLHENIFNEGKSNIKWQESTRAGSAFVASNIGPYKALNDKVALLTENTPEAWYTALKKVIDDVAYREGLVKAAQLELKENWTLEKHWKDYKKMFEKVHNSGGKK